MRTRSRSREEKILGVDPESLLQRCETELRELREELEEAKHVVSNLSKITQSSQTEQAPQSVERSGDVVSCEEHAKVVLLASELQAKCRKLSEENAEHANAVLLASELQAKCRKLSEENAEHANAVLLASELQAKCRKLSEENAELRAKHEAESAERQRLVGVVAARDSEVQRERLEWTATRDEISGNMRVLCQKMEEQRTFLQHVETDLATTKESLRLKSEELVASYGEYAKVDNARASLSIHVQELMQNNASLTAILFQNQPRS